MWHKIWYIFPNMITVGSLGIYVPPGTPAFYVRTYFVTPLPLLCMLIIAVELEAREYYSAFLDLVKCLLEGL